MPNIPFLEVLGARCGRALKVGTQHCGAVRKGYVRAEKGCARAENVRGGRPRTGAHLAVPREIHPHPVHGWPPRSPLGCGRRNATPPSVKLLWRACDEHKPPTGHGGGGSTNSAW